MFHLDPAGGVSGLAQLAGQSGNGGRRDLGCSGATVDDHPPLLVRSHGGHDRDHAFIVTGALDGRPVRNRRRLAVGEEHPVGGQIEHCERGWVEVLRTQDAADAPALERRRSVDGDHVSQGECPIADDDRHLADVPTGDRGSGAVGAGLSRRGRQAGLLNQVEGEDVGRGSGVEDQFRLDPGDLGVDDRGTDNLAARVVHDLRIDDGAGRRQGRSPATTL